LSGPQPSLPTFNNLGDWLIWRATGVFGDFKMPVCCRVIMDEGKRDGWFYQLYRDENIDRILARYKEHVSHWAIHIDVIRSELSYFALAVERPYQDIAIRFDTLPPQRFPFGGELPLR